jgi:hypothetical protein
MSTAGWYDWHPGAPAETVVPPGIRAALDRPVAGLCLSYVSGSEAITPDGKANDAVADHPRGACPFSAVDPLAWHEFAETWGPDQWRLRRTDVWLEDGEIHVDAWFQDSSSSRNGDAERILFHEYAIRARFAADTPLLLAIAVDDRVLPFRTCRAAPMTAQVLVGKDAREFRALVPQILRGTNGCTHLNDMLRSLQDVAAMAHMLGDLLRGA